MTTPPQPPGTTKPTNPAKPTYISSSGHTLDSLPLTARLNRAADTLYNAVGLYFVSLLALDPYAAAQNSRFNTRGPGRTANAARSTGSAPSGFGSARLGGTGGGASAPRGGGGSAGGGAGSGTGGRRMGTVDDVRGPECGSCG